MRGLWPNVLCVCVWGGEWVGVLATLQYLSVLNQDGKKRANWWLQPMIIFNGDLSDILFCLWNVRNNPWSSPRATSSNIMFCLASSWVDSLGECSWSFQALHYYRTFMKWLGKSCCDLKHCMTSFGFRSLHCFFDLFVTPYINSMLWWHSIPRAKLKGDSKAFFTCRPAAGFCFFAPGKHVVILGRKSQKCIF